MEDPEYESTEVPAPDVEHLTLKIGLPTFWLQAFKNHRALGGLITERDEPLMEKLIDIQVKLDDSNTGYTLTFIFEENEFMKDTVLTKQIITKKGE